MGDTPRVLRGNAPAELDRAEFERRFRAPHADPLFEPVRGELEAVLDAGWRAYSL